MWQKPPLTDPQRTRTSRSSQHEREGISYPSQERHHLQLAVAVLVHEARRADYDEGDIESAPAEHALMDLFGLDRGEAAALLQEGRAKAQELTSFYAPVSTIKRDWPLEERIRFVEHLWRISFADGRLNLYEDHYVRKIAHLPPTRRACSPATAPASAGHNDAQIARPTNG